MMRSPTGAIVADPCRAKPTPPDHPGLTKASKPSGKHRCVLGHNHDSWGEASACSPIHTAAAHAGLTVFRPGRPGIPCFRVAPDESGRPTYVSIDWVLVDAAGKVAVLLDWKGAVAKSKRFRGDAAWSRGTRIVESETGCRVVELKELSEIHAAIACYDGRTAPLVATRPTTSEDRA